MKLTLKAKHHENGYSACLTACTIAPFLCSEMTGLNPCF